MEPDIVLGVGAAAVAALVLLMGVALWVLGPSPRRSPPAAVRRDDALLMDPPTVTTTAGRVTLYEWLRQASDNQPAMLVQQVVGAFYDRLAADPAVAGYFPADQVVLRRHFAQALVTLARDGLWQSMADRLAAAHHGVVDGRTGREITGQVFDRVVGHLVAVLSTAGVPTSDECMGQLGRIAQAARPLVVAPAAVR